MLSLVQMLNTHFYVLYPFIVSNSHGRALAKHPGYRNSSWAWESKQKPSGCRPKALTAAPLLQDLVLPRHVAHYVLVLNALEKCSIHLCSWFSGWAVEVFSTSLPVQWLNIDEFTGGKLLETNSRSASASLVFVCFVLSFSRSCFSNDRQKNKINETGITSKVFCHVCFPWRLSDRGVGHVGWAMCWSQPVTDAIISCMCFYLKHLYLSCREASI